MLAPSSPLTRTNPPNGIALIDQITPLRVQPKRRGRNADAELLDLDTAHARGEKVAEFVNKNQDREDRDYPETAREGVREQEVAPCAATPKRRTTIAYVSSYHSARANDSRKLVTRILNPPRQMAGSRGSHTRSGRSCACACCSRYGRRQSGSVRSANRSRRSAPDRSASAPA